MSVDVIELEESRVIRFAVTDTAIAKLKVELTGLTDYKAVSSGIAVVRDLRVSVEATRKALKEDSLAWGRKVDAEAKRITEQLKEIEEPLRLVKQQIDDAKEAAKKAAEAARIAEVERRLKAFEDLEYSINPYKVERFSDAEFCDELENASAKFREVLSARAEAKAQAEADRLEDEKKAEANRLKLEAANAKRLEAIKPDIEKVRAFGDVLRLLEVPGCSTEMGVAFCARVKNDIETLARACERFN